MTRLRLSRPVPQSRVLNGALGPTQRRHQGKGWGKHAALSPPAGSIPSHRWQGRRGLRTPGRPPLSRQDPSEGRAQGLGDSPRACPGSRSHQRPAEWLGSAAAGAEAWPSRSTPRKSTPSDLLPRRPGVCRQSDGACDILLALVHLRPVCSLHPPVVLFLKPGSEWG